MKLKFTLKELIDMWAKTYAGENLVSKHPGFINNLIVEYDNARTKDKE